jgi:hypothetical protein
METAQTIPDYSIIVAIFEIEPGDQINFATKIMFENVLTSEEQTGIEKKLKSTKGRFDLRIALSVSILLLIVVAAIGVPIVLFHKSIPLVIIVLACLFLFFPIVKLVVNFEGI